MAGPALLTSNIEAGAALVRELDARNIQPIVAAWLFFADREEWKLVLQFDEMHQKYATLVEIAGIIGERDDIARGLSMGEITVVEQTDDAVTALKAVIHTGSGVSSIRFGPTIANGLYFEQGLAYRVRDPLIPSVA